MDDHQAELVERYQTSKLKNVSGTGPDSEDEDNLLDLLQELEDEDDSMMHYREQRLEQLKKEFNKVDRAAENKGEDFGLVKFIDDEKSLMDTVTQGGVVVVHFYQPSFPKCKLMNETLAILAEKHVSINVIAITAENAPFLVAKLKIKVLPFVLVYKNSQELTRFVGFEGLGQDPNRISWQLFENKLLQCGAINRKTIISSRSNAKSSTNDSIDDDSGDDWY